MVAMNNQYLKLKINTVYNSIKIMKPWINLTKDVKLYTENCKTLQREIKEILNKWGETLMGQQIQCVKRSVLLTNTL